MALKLASANITNLDAIELNGSCPNVVSADGGRHSILSHNPDLLGEVLSELKDIGANIFPLGDLFVRISPFVNQEDAALLARQLHESGVDAVSAFNTFPGGKPLDASGEPILQVPGGVGGRSGTSTVKFAETQTEWLIDARNEIGASFEILGSNGVTDALSMKRRLDIGASAVSATTLFYEAPRWGNAVNKLLAEFSEL